jgi:nucleoside-diphosphate-sugar epimerase
MKQRRCLITGHKGYIGSRLYEELGTQGHAVAGIDIKGCNIEERILPGENICNGYPIEFYSFNPDIIFHLAAIPRVGYSVEHPVEVMKNNVTSTSITLKLAKYFKIPVVYSSSSSVVGNGSGPTNPYALSKYVGELESVMYAGLYNVDTVSLRYFNVYSSDQEAEGPYATAVANWMKFITEGRRPFITGDGSQKRDMAHVTDVVSANIFCMENIDVLSGKVFDVGTGSNISLNEMKEIVNSILPEVDFEYRSSRQGEVGSTKADFEKFNNFGWKAKIDINDGISQCFQQLKDNITKEKSNEII